MLPGPGVNALRGWGIEDHPQADAAGVSIGVQTAGATRHSVHAVGASEEQTQYDVFCRGGGALIGKRVSVLARGAGDMNSQGLIAPPYPACCSSIHRTDRPVRRRFLNASGGPACVFS